MKRTAAFLMAAGLLLTNAAFANTKCFVVTENSKVIQQEGECQSRHAPCSTFKIPLSLMGFNEGFLIDETHPELAFEVGYVDWVDIWKQPHTPKEWIKNSCLWYSYAITNYLGMSKFQDYVTKLNYGNQDVSGDKGKDNGLTRAWLSSSLKISPIEQNEFLTKLIAEQLPLSKHAQLMTKNIMFVEDFTNGWKLYGKTGSGYLNNKDGSLDEKRTRGWFVGWLQKDDRTIVFSHYIEEENKDIFAGKRAKEAAKEKLALIVQ